MCGERGEGSNSSVCTGLTEKSIQYYKLFISWTSQSVKQSHVKRNAFDFKHISTFDRGELEKPGPCVLFATPGMLHAGTSLEAFKHWAPNPKNLLIIPGYCVVGTVGSRLTAGFTGPVEIDGRNSVHVRCGIAHVSFSAHADAKGIMQLLRQAEPRNVVLVHGEKGKMGFLREKILRELQVPCFDPANGQYIEVQASRAVPIQIATSLLNSAVHECQVACTAAKGDARADKDAMEEEADEEHGRKRHCGPESPFARIGVNGVLVINNQGPPQLMGTAEAAKAAQIPQHSVTMACEVPGLTGQQVSMVLQHLQESHNLSLAKDGTLHIKSLRLSAAPDSAPCMLKLHWSMQDDAIAQETLAAIHSLSA